MLTLSNISKRFGEQTVIRDFSYTFPKTGLFFITGDSGSGKTTLFRILAGLDKEFEGHISPYLPCSFLFQDRRLFSTVTALENVLLALPKKQRKEKKTEAERLLQTLGFSKEDMKKYPPDLSGGMQQRVAIARAFMMDAPFILLDEPTKELDETNRAILRNIIQDYAKHALVLCSTHEADDMEKMDGIRVPLT